MNFWTNPENNSLKTIFVVAIFVGLGYFVYHSVQSTSLTGKGSVIDSETQSDRGGFTFAVTTSGPTCMMNVCAKNNSSQCIPLTGTTASNGMCDLDKTQSSPSAQKLLEVISTKKTQ